MQTALSPATNVDVYRHARAYDCRHPAAFTLVEMLVAVALVLLMMSMFATVFVSATQTLLTQRGIAENDQRGRMLSTVVRGDLQNRTFKTVQPWRANESPPSPDPNRLGYFEIDEGDPSDDTDDVLQFTTWLTSSTTNQNGLKYVGRSGSGLSTAPIATYKTASVVTVAGDYRSAFGTGTSDVWITGSSALTSAGKPYSNDGRYMIDALASPPFYDTANLRTELTLYTASGSLAALYTPGVSANNGSIMLTNKDPDFDDGVIGNGSGASEYAEICYFLRNGNLLRRVLLVRDSQLIGQQQPQWSSNTPIGYSGNTIPPAPSTPVALVSPNSSFWNDYDYSAFYTPVLDGTTTPTPPLVSIGAQTAISAKPAININTLSPLAPTNAVDRTVTSTLTGTAPGIFFHNARDSITNTANYNYAGTPATLASLACLALPYQRFGHSILTGLPQDESSVAWMPGPDLTFGTTDDLRVYVGRFTAQESASPNFGYPAIIPADPVNGGTTFTIPVNRQNIRVDPSTGQVIEYTNSGPYTSTSPYVAIATNTVQKSRRGEDTLLSNVISFDVKVWDPINADYVDIGDPRYPGGPFSVMPYGGFYSLPPANPANLFHGVTLDPVTNKVVSGYTDGVFYTVAQPSGDVTIVGGRLNSAYGSDPINSPYSQTSPYPLRPYPYTTSSDSRYHYRFDTWHPNASTQTYAGPNGLGFYNQPPYFQPGDQSVNVNSYLISSNTIPSPIQNPLPDPSAPTTYPNAVNPYVYFYNEPPFVPVGFEPSTNNYVSFPISALQITINYKDVSTGQIRSMTIIQSLSETLKTVKALAKNAALDTVLVPTP